MKNSKILISFLLVLLVAISMSAVCAADNATYTVDGDDDVAIQTAINNASAGDTINLGSDKTYTINNTITVEKQINIVGTNVVFNGEGQSKSTSTLENGFINVVKEGSGTTISGIAFYNIDAKKITPVQLKKQLYSVTVYNFLVVQPIV